MDSIMMPADAAGIDTTDSQETKPLSAIAAFSNLISTPRKCKDNSPATLSVTGANAWSTGPHSLPTEILRMIFQFVFESCVGANDSVTGDNPALWLYEDPVSPFLFPYAPACVCRRWFRILRTIPIYWTRVVITVDAIAASLHVARTTLGWAGNRPLKIIVTRHHGTSETYDSERAGVEHAMDHLRPHISHIWSLSFDVEHSSSIPALWRERGRAPHLKVLTLLSRSDAGSLSRSSKWLSVGNNHEYEGKLKIPLLQEVTVSGHFLKNPLMAHPRLARWFRHVTSLTICGDAASGGNAISLYKFLSVIDMFPSIRALTVEDVHFDDNAPYPNLLMLRPAVLCLRRITGRTALRGILARARVGSSSRTDITIVDCAVHGFRDPDPDSNVQFTSTNLALASMDPSAPIEDLVCRWNGERLSVIGCPRLSRMFLQRLHGEAAPTCLSQLRLVDCDSFDAGDVIALVQSRETQAACVSLMGADDDSVMALKELRVQGRGPPISVKRARWLAEHVATFCWDTVARDGVRYVWDGSVGRLMVSASGSLEARMDWF
ncbi:hypothetical protein OG21DRAFT_1513326 [Imleria badia]|nr:hypothetical protein OG21DRAFT_1513326 [Imleria badia]